jgi:hypothetical protein
MLASNAGFKSSGLSSYLLDLTQLAVKRGLSDTEQASGFKGPAARLLIGGHDQRSLRNFV